MSRSNNLLLTLDAFGTLFWPKAPVAEQYGQAARRLGLSGFRDDDLQASLLRAFKAEARQSPNYGKATGLGATRWWTNVIHNTFAPLLRHGESIPPELAPSLLHRFSSSQAYTIEPHLVSLLRALKDHRHIQHEPRQQRQRHQQQPPQHQHESVERAFDNILIGVVTNSDDRVPSILSSFGLRVSPLRYGVTAGPGLATVTNTPFPKIKTSMNAQGHSAAPAIILDSVVPIISPDEATPVVTPNAAVDTPVPGTAVSIHHPAPHDIDFHCISYDIGFEKPNAHIFRAAEHMLAHVLAAHHGIPNEDAAGAAATWHKVHVGDEFAKDVVGAVDAGWKAVLLADDKEDSRRRGAGEEGGEEQDRLPWLKDMAGLESFLHGEKANAAARVRSLTTLIRWLVEK